MAYMNEGRARRAAMQQAIPISIVRRTFILAVVASACPGFNPATDEPPRFHDVAGKEDIRIHDTMLAFELKPFSALPDKKARRAHDDTILLREKIMRPYGKLTIFGAFMVSVGILTWLVQNDLYALDDKPELMAVIEEVKEEVRKLDPKTWASTERGTLRYATHILADLAREGFGFGVSESDWKEAFNAVG